MKARETLFYNWKNGEEFEEGQNSLGSITDQIDAQTVKAIVEAGGDAKRRASEEVPGGHGQKRAAAWQQVATRQKALRGPESVRGVGNTRGRPGRGPEGSQTSPQRAFLSGRLTFVFGNGKISDK